MEVQHFDLSQCLSQGFTKKGGMPLPFNRRAVLWIWGRFSLLIYIYYTEKLRSSTAVVQNMDITWKTASWWFLLNCVIMRSMEFECMRIAHWSAQKGQDIITGGDLHKGISWIRHCFLQ